MSVRILEGVIVVLGPRFSLALGRDTWIERLDPKGARVRDAHGAWAELEWSGPHLRFHNHGGCDVELRTS